MQLDRSTKLKIKWGLAITAGLSFWLTPLGTAFWVLFWVLTAAFVIVGSLVDLFFPDQGD